MKGLAFVKDPDGYWIEARGIAHVYKHGRTATRSPFLVHLPTHGRPTGQCDSAFKRATHRPIHPCVLAPRCSPPPPQVLAHQPQAVRTVDCLGVRVDNGGGYAGGGSSTAPVRAAL